MFRPATRSPTSTPTRRRVSRAPRPTPPTLQAERNDPVRRAAGDALRQQPVAATPARCCWCCRAWTPRARAGSSNTLSERSIRRASGTRASASRPRRSWQHHYLWRIRRALPPAGHIGVFDRSHYEDVLIVRVHDLVPPEVWGTRYDEINAFEKRARRRRHDDRQGRDVRLARRAEEAAGRSGSTARQVLEVQPGRHRRARCCGRSTRRPTRRCSTSTSTDYAPWHVMPCDRKWYSRLAITELLIEALEGLNLSWPPADFDVEAEKKRLQTTRSLRRRYLTRVN